MHFLRVHSTSQQTSSLWEPLSLSRRVLGVCVKHFFCLFHFSLKPLWVPALSFCYHKEIGVSIAGRALVAQAPVHCSME